MNEHIADQRHLALVDTIRAQQAQITRLGLSVLELSTLVQMLVRLHDGRLVGLEERCDEQLVMIDVLNSGLVNAHERIAELMRRTAGLGPIA